MTKEAKEAIESTGGGGGILPQIMRGQSTVLKELRVEGFGRMICRIN